MLLMSFNKRSRLMRTLLTTNIGGCGCSKPKPSDVYDPTPIPKISSIINYQLHTNTNPNSLTPSSTTTTTSRDRNGDDNEDEDFTTTSTTISEADHDNKNTKINHDDEIPKPSTKLIGSIAIEKDSNDPHEDFRNSILQMILEREMYTETDLQQLLQCLLQLNAPCHHKVIVQAFVEICEETFPKKLHTNTSVGNATS